MIKFLITTPFRHQYRSKDIWLTAGESYYLNPVLDKEEIIYLLSGQFPYREYVYINQQDIPVEISQYIRENGFYENIRNFAALEEPIVKDVLDEESVISNGFLPPIDAPNPTITDGKGASPSQEGDNVGLEEVAVEQITKEGREEQLESMTARQIKALADSKDIEYRNKTQAIKDILAQEAL